MKMSNNPAKYEILINQYLRSILDISGRWNTEILTPSLGHDQLDFITLSRLDNNNPYPIPS